MYIQKSYDNSGQGVLYIVGLPIGNFEDLTPRAKEILENVDAIAAEDPWKSKTAYGKHIDFKAPFLDYNMHNWPAAGPKILDRIEKGESIALISDAGMPAICDPGEDLVRQAVARGLHVVPLPGANAAILALVASGLAIQPFLFMGFIPPNPKERREELERWNSIEATLIMYDSPVRLINMLQDALDIYGDRQAAIVRHLTRRAEEWVRGSLSECLSHFKAKSPQGEYTVIIQGINQTKRQSYKGKYK